MNEEMLAMMNYSNHSTSEPIVYPNYILPTMIEVEPLPCVMDATDIYLEPCKTSDWEMVEIFAQELESGLLLQQVSIVYPDQILPLYIGSDYVYLRVLEQGFGNNNENGKVECLRLVTSSQIIISPKPRNKTEKQLEYPVSIPLRIQPTVADFSMDMKKFFDAFQPVGSKTPSCTKMSSMIIHSPPLLCVWVHPKTLQKLPGWKEINSSNNGGCANVLIKKCSNQEKLFIKSKEKDSVAIANVSSNEEMPTDCIGKQC